MKKNKYLDELTITKTQKKDGDNNKKDVMKIQSWLSLYAIQHPASGTVTGIDGDFGPATEKAVKNFQKSIQVEQNGVVTPQLFEKLSQGMKDAFEKPLQSSSLRNAVVEAAENHLKNTPFELEIKGQQNSGPWVRAYMDGHDGSLWYWCMGFAQTILDQAASALGKDFRSLMPLTYSCDTVGTTGLSKGLLTRYQSVRNNPSVMKPGDFFLLQKSRYDWTHTGIIISVGNDVIETIEGNTNQAGSRNGIAVLKRTRNFRKSKLDVFSIEPLV
ncbi:MULTISPECIES: peptidoglycan-binding protein [Aequorivita]|uniref:Peptidoglycan-binding protein n=1 Tax=Aequorivita iocasae TaxID=2803865 RepID=A0ABX7DQR4_9FLAO|nr:MULTISPECIES: peptidoglycan-binding protein [Aequorivita]QQX75893.1 peptidoglycan-binding protein [Aequorivita iocasae]UCA55355.1 peptidoglycan-binding protein [Aequorivita sp. F7]